MAASMPRSAAVHAPDTLVSVVTFCVGFVVFLAIALIAEMLTMRWRTWLPGAEGGRSLVADVTSAVYTFMSYIP